MKYTDLLKKRDVEIKTEKRQVLITEKEKTKAEDVLRSAGYKIKLVTPTAFGTQIDFAKKYDDAEIKDTLTNYNIKIKDKSVFIVD